MPRLILQRQRSAETVRHSDDIGYLTDAEGRAAADTNAGQMLRAWSTWAGQIQD